MLKTSKMQTNYDARGPIYKIEMSHEGVHKYRLIQGRDYAVVVQKAEAQQAAWKEAWQRREARDQKSKDRESKAELATRRTQEAEIARADLENTLSRGMSGGTVGWDILKDASKFAEPKPRGRKHTSLDPAPQATDAKYQPSLGILDRLLSSRRISKEAKAKLLFQSDLGAWETAKEALDKENAELHAKLQEEIKQWDAAEEEFYRHQKEKNEKIEARKADYRDGNIDAIVEYCELILSKSEYPDSFPQQFELAYNPETRMLVVNYSLPAIDAFPRVKEVRYISSRDELAEIELTESILNKLYDSVIYQITLRTIFELYRSDEINAFDSIVFNGWVRSTSKATGQEINSCILSVQAGREQFLSINLANVDPKACFRSLKGIGSSRLHSLSAVAPILNINREDKRFVSSYDVADYLDESSNLAAMDWMDFEQLIRELFEKEFSQNGGEVKVTQASRDGGVDAVAFDPDPIRGGKLVIQAKRYTNTVGVAAVRDLYGTVINEGATKGILITTSDYGPDAYDFAKGKPLTLLTGGNLLALLEKHGRKATINLTAAKQILAEAERAQTAR